MAYDPRSEGWSHFCKKAGFFPFPKKTRRASEQKDRKKKRCLWPSKDPLSQKELNAHQILIVRPRNSFLMQKKAQNLNRY